MTSAAFLRQLFGDAALGFIVVWTRQDKRANWFPATCLINARHFEEIFSLSRRTFFQYIADGRLIAYRPSPRKTLVKRQDVERLIEASRAGTDLDRIVDEVIGELEAGK